MSPKNRTVAEPARGEVWLVTFYGAAGGEIQKTRPAVIISNDTANALINRVQVVPISSRTERLYPSEALVVLNGEQRKAMADQITTVAKQRLLRRLAVMRAEDMIAVSRTVGIQLGL
jgi:mRNA interferase MazF